MEKPFFVPNKTFTVLSRVMSILDAGIEQPLSSRHITNVSNPSVEENVYLGRVAGNVTPHLNFLAETGAIIRKGSPIGTNASPTLKQFEVTETLRNLWQLGYVRDDSHKSCTGPKYVEKLPYFAKDSVKSRARWRENA